jgi:pentatricopeptide repeat protein
VQQAGDVPGAKQVLADMQAAGVPPNTVTYTILMDRLVATDDLKVMHPNALCQWLHQFFTFGRVQLDVS